VEMWDQGPRFIYRYRGPEKVVGVTVDPDAAFPDVNRSNNSWSR